MKKSIGVMGVVNTIVGFVIGASIFIMPGQLAAIAGPGVVIAYLIAGLLGLLVCIVTAQLGTAVPVEGGGFVIISRLLSPFFGFVTFFLTICATAVATAFLAFGFADYFSVFFEGANRLIVAFAVVVAFGAVNTLGSRLVVDLQTVLVFWFMVALALFAYFGFSNIDPANLSPFVPNGSRSVFEAATLAYFSFAGFAFLLEIGGEIKKPRRTIPIGLAIGFVIVLVSYIGVSLALVGVVHWQTIGGEQAPVAYAAKQMMPQWMVIFLTSSVLAAAATSINGLVFAYPRDLWAMARIGILPEKLSFVSRRTSEPVLATATFVGLALVATSFNAGLADYAAMIVLALMFQQIMMAIALYRLPRVLPDAYANSGIKLGRTWINILAVLLILSSSFFVYILISSDLFLAWISLAAIGLATSYYLLRSLTLRLAGKNLKQSVEDLLSRSREESNHD